MRSLLRLFFILLIATAAGCSSWLIKGEPPEVLVSNITPLENTPFEQRLKVDLRVRNPNDYDLQVTGLAFNLELNGKRLARGLGNKEFLIPRLGEALVSVDTSTSTFDTVRLVLDLRKARQLTYGISGVLHLKDGRLPFDNTGVFLEPGELSSLTNP